MRMAAPDLPERNPNTESMTMGSKRLNTIVPLLRMNILSEAFTIAKKACSSFMGSVPEGFACKVQKYILERGCMHFRMGGKTARKQLPDKLRRRIEGNNPSIVHDSDAIA